MKKFTRVISTPVMSSVLSAVILVALCFSVGEGLRLTPFPVSNLAPTQETNVSLAGEISVSQYGPLNIPSQNQKRNKRQVFDLAGPTAIGARYAAPRLSAVLDSPSIDLISVLSVTRPAGRAPPTLS